ncbi:hypothetical protein MMC30_002937 [Trapelia coarctata]|nr:hypothetical protein [Trapelia coarctata]
MLNGQLPYRVKCLHDHYGSVVRVAPDELSMTDPEAWKDIYSSKEFIRPIQWGQRPPGVEAHTLISAPVDDHARFRKAMAPAFSGKALKLQEPIIMHHLDILMDKLHRFIDDSPDHGSAVVNLVEWINFTAFDIISDLGWGSSFNCLKSGKYHPWIVVVLHYQALLFAVSINFYPFLRTVAQMFTPKSAMAGLNMVISTSERNVNERLLKKTESLDFMSYVMAHNKAHPSAALSEKEMVANSTTLIVGGSDPVTTVLAGALNHLLRHPKVMAKLVQEIRSNFHTDSNISAASTQPLVYLTAVIQESLRVCPPTPDSMRRAIPKGGATILGHSMPEGIVVGVSCYAAFKSKANFFSPDDFLPERWLSHSDSQAESPYRNDRQACFHPFGRGPRGCIGQALAWVELRVFLARLLYSFDIKEVESLRAQAWTSQKIFWAWHKDEAKVCISKAASTVFA